MKKREAKRQMRFAGAVAVLALITGVILSTLLFFSYADAEGGKPAATLEGSELLSDLMEKTTHFVVVKHKQLGASHYAYTDALAETNGDPAPHSEYVFNPGSQLVLLTLSENEDGSVSTYEQELLNSRRGVIRDPDVNPEGTKILFSHKTTDSDDYHLYEMDIATKNVTQLTFGSGHSDIEPKYLANGNIVFNSNRDVQTVDCWYTPVCNLYILYRESGSTVRVGYDQVHTTYPTVTSDGRILYTRWDYNDRTQMYVQSLFQMFQDGTNQTEVYGNGSNFPTTLLHTREVPGETGVYLSIASGHHMYQYGKPVLVDTSKGRNDDAAVTFLFPDQYTREKPDNVDTGHYASEGKIYKYPYALNSDEYLISTAKKYDGVKTAFDICLMNRKGESVTLVKGSTALPASQIVPIMGTKLFNRPSAVNYASSTGTYYVANVYDGEGMKGVEKGSAKYLRVVELVYRQAAIGATIGSGTGSSDPYSPIATGNGAWDVKAVLGVVPIEEDGSALFRVPADTPVYFQILDDKGDMIQSMRSWTTLMPGETFSCVGCHEEKNQVPPASAGVTLAMQKGVQDLQKDLWMEENEEYAAFDPYEDKAIGFSYLRQVQTIFNESCVSCHSNTDAALTKIKAGDMTNAEASIRAAGELIPAGAVWSCTSEASDSRSVRLPIGKLPVDAKRCEYRVERGTSDAGKELQGDPVRRGGMSFPVYRTVFRQYDHFGERKGGCKQFLRRNYRDRHFCRSRAVSGRG